VKPLSGGWSGALATGRVRYARLVTSCLPRQLVRALLLTLATCAPPLTGCASHAPAPPGPATDPELPKLEPAIHGAGQPPLGHAWGARHEAHIPAARRAIRRIAALADRYPALRGALEHAMIVAPGPSLLARWGHRSGTRLVPNPLWDPARPESPVPQHLEELAPGGLRLDLTFYDGPWTGLDTFEPVPFGELGVRLLVDSPDVATRAALEREIRAALAAEAPR
jgi:hypothetical protein